MARGFCHERRAWAQGSEPGGSESDGASSVEPGLAREPPRLHRRAWLRTSLAAAAAVWVAPARAEDVVVPVPLQIKLLVKVAGYDKNLPARAGKKVKVHVSAKAKDQDAQRIAAAAVAALAEHDSIAGLPIEVSSSAFASGADLKKLIQKEKLAIVYLATGLSAAEVDGVASALEGVDVLSASAAPGDVARKIVLGFDLVSGKPKLLVHLGQAKKQNVALSADVLKLAKVVE